MALSHCHALLSQRPTLMLCVGDAKAVASSSSAAGSAGKPDSMATAAASRLYLHSSSQSPQRRCCPSHCSPRARNAGVSQPLPITMDRRTLSCPPFSLFSPPSPRLPFRSSVSRVPGVVTADPHSSWTTSIVVEPWSSRASAVRPRACDGSAPGDAGGRRSGLRSAGEVTLGVAIVGAVLLACPAGHAALAAAAAHGSAGPYGQGELGWAGDLLQSKASGEGGGGAEGGSGGVGDGGGGRGGGGGGGGGGGEGMGGGGSTSGLFGEKDEELGSGRGTGTGSKDGSLVNSGGAELMFASLSASVGGATGGTGGGGGNCDKPAGVSPGTGGSSTGTGGGPSASAAASGSGGGVGSGGGAPRKSEGMFDWLASLLHSLLASRLDAERIDRQALMVETADLVMEMLDKRSSEDAFAHRSEVSALRRLQREAFQDLLRLRERLEKLEYYTGLRKADSAVVSAAAAAAAAAGAARRASAAAGSGGGRTRVTGEVATGAALVPAAEGDRSHSARAALEQAGMRSGLTVRFNFETAIGSGGAGAAGSRLGEGGGVGGGVGDVLVTEATAGLGEDSSSFMLGGPMNLHKVVFGADVADGVRVVVAPLGALGSDVVSEAANPLKGQGLTRFSSGGVALHRRTKGSALGLTLHNKSVAFTAAQFISGWGITADAGADGDGPGLCASTLAQLSLKPTEGMVLSAAAVNRVWPAPPLPSSPGLHWSEMGPLVVPKLLPSLFGGGSKGGSVAGSVGPGWSGGFGPDGTASSISGSMGGGIGGPGSVTGQELVGQELWLPPAVESATTLMSLAVAARAKLGRATTVAAWVQAENAEWLEEEEKHRMQWSVSLLHKPEAATTAAAGGTGGSGLLGRCSYGVCVGTAQPDAFSSVAAAAAAGANGSNGGGPVPPTPSGQFQMEAFVGLPVGRGLTLQPGVLVTNNKQSGWHHALMLRSSWAL